MNKWIRIVTLASLASLALAGCGRTSDQAASKIEPAVVESIEGAKVSRVTLTPKAAERLQIDTEAIGTRKVGSSVRKVIPYAALLYDADGSTWVFTNPKPLLYVRAPVDVVRIDGSTVILKRGPVVGTQVVTVGVAELYGVEFGVGK